MSTFCNTNRNFSPSGQKYFFYLNNCETFLFTAMKWNLKTDNRTEEDKVWLKVISKINEGGNSISLQKGNEISAERDREKGCALGI